MAEVIEIQSNADNENWIPFVGDETNELLRSKGFANTDRTLNENGQRVLDETYRIMQVCGNPNIATNSETGIVIGYVQSGAESANRSMKSSCRAGPKPVRPGPNPHTQPRNFRYRCTANGNSS